MLKFLTHSWFLLNFFFVLFWISPASAARLLDWRFESNQNQLTFNTDESVQPTAQVINNPTRLVIDLPGVSRGNITRNQFVGGLIREVRVGQFDAQTTRIVVEMAAGYAIDPQQVSFQPTGDKQWRVQIPAPQPLDRSSLPPTTNLVIPNNLGAGNPSNPLPWLNSDNAPLSGQSLPFQVISSGFFLTGITGNPQIKSRRSDDRRTLEFEVEGANFPPNLIGQPLAINRYGVGQIQFTQIRNSVVRITMGVSSEAPDWQALYNSQAQALLLAPLGVSTAELERQTGANSSNSPSSSSRLAVIQSLELSGDRTQLLIRANQSLNASGSFDSNRNFRITIPNAQVANPLPQPRLEPNSPISRLQVLQQDAQTVVIVLQPSFGARFGQVNQLSDQLSALQIFPQAIVGSSFPSNNPSSSFPTAPTNLNIELPSVRGRPVVVIDPGHGGRDPGAVGISGLQEADIVLDISQQVTSLLEGQGVQARLTRTQDIEIDLAPRVEQANRANADLFVSIHANAINMSRPDVNGLETYYLGSGLELANTIHRSILQAIPDLPDRRVRRANFYVLRNTQMPAVLVETGFVTGADDARRLQDAAYRSRMAAAIARGILQYLQQR